MTYFLQNQCQSVQEWLNNQQQLRGKVEHSEGIESHVQVKNTYKGHYGRWRRGEQEAVGTRDSEAIKEYRLGKEKEEGPAGKTSGEYNIDSYRRSITSPLHVGEISYTTFCPSSFPEQTSFHSRNNQQYALVVPLLYCICWFLHVSAVVCHHQGAS
jgi:hypothetical protein